jgi:uncharacterized membrane protein
MSRNNIRFVATILALIGIVLTLLSAASTHQVFYLVLCFVLVAVVLLNVLTAVRARKQKGPP